MLNISEYSKDNVAEEVDYTGSKSYILDSDVYNITVKQCYGIKQPSGSMCLRFTLETSDGRTVKSDQYFLSKKGTIYYKKKAGTNQHIPGFSRCAGIMACAFPEEYKEFIKDIDNGETLTKRHESFFQGFLNSMKPGQVTEYNYDTKEDEIIDVDNVLTLIVGKTFKAAIAKNMVSKKEKDATGTYIATSATRDENEVVLEFSNAGLSSVEMRGGIVEPVAMPNWIKNKRGEIFDNRDKDFKGTAVPSPGQQQEQTTQTGTIFDNM